MFLRGTFRTPLDAYRASGRADALERKAHDNEIAEFAWNHTQCTVRVHHDGSMIEVVGLPGWQPHEPESGRKRGKCGPFSTKHSRRMMKFLGGLRRDELPLFITLTYGSDWDRDATVWKRDLDTFAKWLRRHNPKMSALWKLEPQQRGAPHFHLLVWGVPFLPWQKLSVRWTEIIYGVKLKGCPIEKGLAAGLQAWRRWVDRLEVNREIIEHLDAGCRVERVRSWNGVMSYASKGYMGKSIAEFPEDWINVGRWWGVIGQKNLPKSRVKEFPEDASTGIRFGRIIRRYLAAKHRERCRRLGLKPRKRRAYHMRTIYTQDFLLWSRALTCAAGGAEYYDHERKIAGVHFSEWCWKHTDGEVPF